MKRLSNIDLLNIWEDHKQNRILERSLYLLSTLYEKDVNAIASVSLGERDAMLMRFREWIFGPRMINVAQCPHCSTPVEWESDIKDLMIKEVDPEMTVKIFTLESDSFRIDFRLPNSFDIMEAYSDRTLAGNPLKFISKCILRIQKDGEESNVESLSPEIYSLIEQRMSVEDPQADIKMVLSCPECKNQWAASFDILTYLWLEIDNWAKRLLKEVALLARAFSWSEKDILSLSFQRRKLYLEMTG